MSSEAPSQSQEVAAAAAAVGANGAGRGGVLLRLRAALAAPFALTRWRSGTTTLTASSTTLHPGSPTTPRAFSFMLDDDDGDYDRGEVSLYPIYIDSDDAQANADSPEPRKRGTEPLCIAMTNRKPEPVRGGTGHIDFNEIQPDDTAGTVISTPRHSRMAPVASVAAAKVKCVCWALAQKMVREVLERAVGATQRWLFKNVCSRRTRLTVIGVFSLIWGMVVSGLSVCLLLAAINGNIEELIEEAAMLGEWKGALITFSAAIFLGLHIAQILFGALLVAASKVSGSRSSQKEDRLLETFLLLIFELLKINRREPPPAPCNHPSPSPSPVSSSSSNEEITEEESPKTIVIEQPPKSPPLLKDSTLPPVTTQSESNHIGWQVPGESSNPGGLSWPPVPNAWIPFSTSSTNFDAAQMSLSCPSSPNSNQNASNSLPYPYASGQKNSNYITHSQDITNTKCLDPFSYPCDPFNPYQAQNSINSNFHISVNPVHQPVSGYGIISPKSATNTERNEQSDVSADSLKRDGLTSGEQEGTSGFQPAHGHGVFPCTPHVTKEEHTTIDVASYMVNVHVINRKVPDTSHWAHNEHDEPQSGGIEEQEAGWSCPSPVPHMLMPWLYTSCFTLGFYFMLSSVFCASGRGTVAAVMTAIEVPAVACVMDVFAELGGVPETCGCKEAKSSSDKKTNGSSEVKDTPRTNKRCMSSPRVRSPPCDETSPLL